MTYKSMLVGYILNFPVKKNVELSLLDEKVLGELTSFTIMLV